MSKKKKGIVDAIETVIPDHTVISTLEGFTDGLGGDVGDVNKAGGLNKVAQAIVPDKTVWRTGKGTLKGIKEDVDEIKGKKKKHKETKLI